MREEIFEKGQNVVSKIKVGKTLSWFVGGILAYSLASNSIYTIDEGNQGVVKRFGQAIEQVDPGFHFKIPYADVVESIEIRTRKNVETMPVATKEQMRANATVSVNWTAKKEAVLDLYKQYGSLSQFESRMLDPRLRSVSKQSVSKFTAEDNINQREVVKSMIEAAFREATVSLPIDIESVQYEDIELPKKYLNSIDAKQTAKNQRDAEQFKLEKQKLVALQEVNTADAKRQANEKLADGNAYRTRVEAEANAAKIKMIGEAEAKKIDAITKAMKANPQYVELVKAQQWDGALPKTIMSEGTGVLMDIRK